MEIQKPPANQKPHVPIRKITLARPGPETPNNRTRVSANKNAGTPKKNTIGDNASEKRRKNEKNEITSRTGAVSFHKGRPSSVGKDEEEIRFMRGVLVLGNLLENQLAIQ